MTAWISLALLALYSTSPAQDDSARVAMDPVPESSAAQEVVADPRAPRTVAIYDLADLAWPPGFDERFESFSPESRRFRQEAGAERLRHIERAIRQHARPKFLRGLDELQVHGITTFVVTATAEHHAWIRQFLELQRAPDAPFLMFDTKQIRATRAELEALGLEGPTELLPDRQHAGALTERLATAGVEVLTAPQLLIGSGSQAHIDLFTEVAYVKGYEVVYVHPGPHAIADPVIDVVKEGTHCELAGIEVEPGLYALEIEFERTEIERPIPTKEVQVTVDSTPVTISQPTVLTSQLSSTVLLRDGAGVWFRVPDGEQELLVLVRLDLVTAPDRDLLERPTDPDELAEPPSPDEPLPPSEPRVRKDPR